MNSSQELANLPDDFFNDLGDERFIDEVVEQGDDSDDDILNYVAEISKLQKDIEIRKQKIKETEASLTKRRRSRSRSRSKSRSRSRKERSHKERDIKRRRTRSRSRSRSKSPVARHSRYDERIREKRYPLSPIRKSSPPSRGRALRRSKSPSHQHRKRSSSTHKNISFLEELAQKFAEKGQAFPEKDALLMNQNPINMQNPSVQVDAFGNPLTFPDQQIMQPMIYPPAQMPQVGFPGQSNMYYGLNPMSILAGNAVPPQAANLPFIPAIGAPNEMVSPILPQGAEPTLTNNQKALIERCDQAIKLIRAKENKVPVMKFMYNRTSLVSTKSNDLASKAISKSPLNAHSTLNTSFKLNAPSNLYVKNPGLKVLPKRVKDVAIALGIKSSFLFDKMRKKELTAKMTSNNQVRPIDDVANQVELLIQTRTTPLPLVETNEIAIQTEFECENCVERDSRMMVNVPTQTTILKTISIGVQTNEKDYREPIVELLSRMTAAQLVAIKDFANIVDEPRPRDREEMFKIRERLMDIYSLSQRDADTVRAAEDSRIDGGQYIDNLRFRDARDGDMFRDGPSRDMNRRSNSPGFNGNINNGGNFGPNDFNDRHMVDGYRIGGIGDRFPNRMDNQFSRRITPEEDEELERRRYMEMERRRQEELEIEQKQYDAERMEMERRQRMEQDFTMNFQRLNQGMPFEEDPRFNNEPDDRGNMFNAARGMGQNRRGRGAFRDNFRGARGSRR